jgi:cytochrome bd-type quinol oxidase subunit 1
LWAAYEAIATLVFILSALFLQREAANVRESSVLNRALMESVPGVVAYSILRAISGDAIAISLATLPPTS